MNFEKEISKYWHVIHWNAVSFLTGHDGRNSRLLRDDFAPDLIQDIVYGFRSTFISTAKLLKEIVLCFLKRKIRLSKNRQPYLILITLDSPKYAGEKQKILEACARNKLNVLIIYPGQGFSESGIFIMPFNLILVLTDYLNAIKSGFREIISGVRFFFSGDRKLRSLFVSTIASIQPYFLNKAIAQSLVHCYGKPQLVLSLCPFSSASIAMIEYFKNNDIFTAGIRTQTTSFSLEHLVINTEVLFVKSLYEKSMYEAVLSSRGPRLEEGCLLSLPKNYQNIVLDLPEQFILLLGTAMGAEQKPNDYYDFNDALFRIAGEFNLPIVFKGHNLSKKNDDIWFQNQGEKIKCMRVSDMQKNRALIDRAFLVVTAPSTLVYYAILKIKPMIILQTSLMCSAANEFNSSPIIQIKYNQKLDKKYIDINELIIVAKDTLSWFTSNYYLDKGPDYIVNFTKCKIFENQMLEATTEIIFKKGRVQ